MSKIIQMKDSEGINLYPKVLEEYSTTEQIIGRWIDGKPIYRKTFNSTLNSAKSGTVNIGANISQVVNISGFIKSKWNNWWCIPNYYGAENEYWTSVTYNNGASEIGIVTGSYYPQGQPYILTVEYTKTTD